MALRFESVFPRCYLPLIHDFCEWNSCGQCFSIDDLDLYSIKNGWRELVSLTMEIGSLGMLLFFVRNIKLLFVISDIRLRVQFVLLNAQSGHSIGQCCLRHHLNHIEF